jgi:hypothetical protein
MVTHSKDPLDQLVMKATEIEGEHRKLLADLLKPHVRMDPDTGRVYFISHPPHLNTKQHVLVFLLAKLALAQKNDKLNFITSAKDVEDATGLPGGTVRPKLGELFKERIVSKSPTGYFVEVTNLHKARAILENTLSSEESSSK